MQLWMGTHPSCPSTLLKSGEDLKQYIKSHPELLGEKVHKKFGEDLPFLFKVRPRLFPRPTKVLLKAAH